MEKGATTIECDVQLTSDGQLVISHNPVLNPDITVHADRPWILRSFLESKGKHVSPARDIDLPYHLDPDHHESGGSKAENGKDAAY